VIEKPKLGTTDAHYLSDVPATIMIAILIAINVVWAALVSLVLGMVLWLS
jgi:hypothetical protein